MTTERDDNIMQQWTMGQPYHWNDDDYSLERIISHNPTEWVLNAKILFEKPVSSVRITDRGKHYWDAKLKLDNRITLTKKILKNINSIRLQKELKIFLFRLDDAVNHINSLVYSCDNNFEKTTFMDKDKMMSEKRKFLQELLQHILLILEYRAGEKIEYEKVMQDLKSVCTLLMDEATPNGKHPDRHLSWIEWMKKNLYINESGDICPTCKRSMFSKFNGCFYCNTSIEGVKK